MQWEIPKHVNTQRITDSYLTGIPGMLCIVAVKPAGGPVLGALKVAGIGDLRDTPPRRERESKAYSCRPCVQSILLWRWCRAHPGPPHDPRSSMEAFSKQMVVADWLSPPANCVSVARSIRSPNLSFP